MDVLLKPFLQFVKSRVRDVYDLIKKIPVFLLEDLPFIEIISVDVKGMFENLTQNTRATRFKILLDPVSKFYTLPFFS